MENIHSIYGDKGIFAYCTREDIVNNNDAILTCYTEPVEGKSKPVRHFQLDLTPEDLFNRVTSVPVSDRHFFEVILGERRQKPHFDIDIQGGMEKQRKDGTGVIIVPNGEELVNLANKIISELLDVLCQLVARDDIVIYTSHGENKRSFHVIINSWFCVNNLHAKELYYYVTERMSNITSCFLDNMVYSALQQFRMLGSCKPGHVKRLKIKINKPVPLTYLDLKESLISHIPPSAVEMPHFIEEEPLHISPVESPSDAIVDSALYLMSTHSQLQPGHARFDKVIKNYIILRKMRDIYCSKCNVVHYSNNPYLIINPLPNDRWNVYYCCRESSPWLLGELRLEAEKEVKPPTKTINLKKHSQKLNLYVNEQELLYNTDGLSYDEKEALYNDDEWSYDED